MGRRSTRSIAVAAALVLIAGCGSADSAGPAGSGTLPAPLEILDLPAPSTDGGLPLDEAIASRRSHRDFAPDPLSTAELSQLLWAAQGITQRGGAGRASPSAGGTYPLELFVVAGDGVSHYLPDGHRLEVLGGADLREPLGEAAVGQQHVADAAAVIVMAAIFSRTEERYGERAERYVHMEAGHAAQNVLLEAVSLGLGAVPVGAFGDDDVAELLGLPADHEPLYLIAVGRRSGG
jgi:SagB-type dehydrogenase family enzyme